MQVLEMLDPTIKEKSIEATIDPLTQLKNRRALESESKELTQSALISNSYFIIFAMININHFKLIFINDTYGHDIGDDILKLISQVLKSSLRKKNIYLLGMVERSFVLFFLI